MEKKSNSSTQHRTLFRSLRPEEETKHGKWTVVSTPFMENRHKKVKARCQCGTEKTVHLDNLTSGKSKACHSCGARTSKFPRWLRDRMSVAKDRCQNPNNDRWKDYGGRGIRFEFESIQSACAWMTLHCGTPDRSMQIDRIDNTRHYAPGNLRWATPQQNAVNRRCVSSRRTVMPPDWKFIQSEWPFTQHAVNKKLALGMTRSEIIESAKEVVRNRKSHWRQVAEKLESMTL